jgi:hypothetical protein
MEMTFPVFTLINRHFSRIFKFSSVRSCSHDASSGSYTHKSVLTHRPTIISSHHLNKTQTKKADTFVMHSVCSCHTTSAPCPDLENLRYVQTVNALFRRSSIKMQFFARDTQSPFVRSKIVYYIISLRVEVSLFVASPEIEGRNTVEADKWARHNDSRAQIFNIVTNISNDLTFDPTEPPVGHFFS